MSAPTKRKNGRRKGATAERDVAKQLQAWWEQVVPGVIFKRTPMSGGWANASARQGFRVSGDVVCTDEKFPFSVECKRREGWSPKNLVEGLQSPVWKWWRQALTQGAEANQTSMLWLRRNAERSPYDGRGGRGAMPPVWLVMIPKDVWDSIPGLPYPDVIWDGDKVKASGNDFWDVLPIGIMAYRLLAIDPKKFVK